MMRALCLLVIATDVTYAHNIYARARARAHNKNSHSDKYLR